MDDQFNGRTDDDLFADDFEPVADPVSQSQPKPDASPIPVPTVENQSAAAASSSQTSQPTAVTHAPGLAQSRHAGPAQRQPPRKASLSKPAQSSNSETSTPSDPASTPAPSGKPRPGTNTALADRLASGANPRTKLSETQLAEKMEQMRILSAEKARKFEQAERDSRSHALAYEKGMEEEKRRQAEAAEQRRRGEEQRRQMDQERAANRERKLKAMGAKDGGWDDGKPAEDERDRRGFRGANGGIRGARNMHNPDRESPVMEFSPDEFRGRGRGRGRGGSRGGRGGRGAFAERNAANGPSPYQQKQQKQQPQMQQQPAKPEQIPPTAEDFPALPSSKAAPVTITNADDLITSSALKPGEKLGWDEY
ncbi:hypothetical protein GGS21DRAFT_130960 [Xylaria nigripes]|nr:hypothetical protein GGS21DRAFT_130960 [Xylaria nigripes]